MIRCSGSLRLILILDIDGNCRFVVNFVENLFVAVLDR